MVFASRRTCIEPYLVDWILREDEYRPVHDLEEIQPGDIVVYRQEEQVTHVAVIVGTTDSFGTSLTMAISQWGAAAEYIHPIEDVPEEFFGRPTEYWTDRRKHNES